MKTQKTIVKTFQSFLLMCQIGHSSGAFANEAIDIKIFEKDIHEAVAPLKNYNSQISRSHLEMNQSLIKKLNFVDGEINNAELVGHHGYQAKIQDLVFYESILANSEKLIPAVGQDQVNHVQASYTKKETPAILDNGDDLVMFDYSDKNEESKAAVLGKGTMSSTVKNAISREMTKNKSIVKIHGIKEIKETKKQSARVDSANLTTNAEVNALLDGNDDAIVYEYKKNVKRTSDKNSILKALEESRLAQASIAEVIVNAREIKLGSKKSNNIQGFEFVPDFERGQRISDGGTGDIKISYAISDDKASVLTGVIQAQNLIPTRVELNLENQNQVVPLLNEADIQKFLEKKQLHVVGNIIMAEMDGEIRDVEIDSKYQAKIFLDESLKLTETVAKAQYVMFLGTQVGNTLIKYLLTNSRTASKIVYVGDGEMYFDSAEFVSSERELYSFMTRSLLGKTVRELSISEDLISVLGTNAKSKQRTLNTYELKLPEMIRGERNYLEFKHHGYSLFVGTKGINELEVPGNDFIGKAMEVNGLTSIGERCMVQVNLDKELRNFEVSGKNKQGEMFVETTYLDQDGVFSVDSSEWAEKVFITGDMEGMFNAKIEYADGSVHFLKTFCSQGSYIVEQL